MTTTVSYSKRILLAICAGLEALPPAVVAFFIYRYGVDVPFWDQWELVPLLVKMQDGNLQAGDLWMLHNEHRLLFPRMIMLMLARVTGWNIFYEMAVNLLLAICFFLVCVPVWRRVAGRHALWLLPIFSWMVFSLKQWENWLWGWQIALFLNVLAVGAALLLLAQSSGRRVAFAFALVAGIVASFSFASGLLVWPIGFLLILVMPVQKQKMKFMRLTFWLLVAVVVTGAYLHGYSTPSHHPPVWNFLKNPQTFVLYVLSFLGSPVTTSHAKLAGAFGLALYALLAFAALIWSREKSNEQRFFLTLGLYGIGCALMTGMGRVGFGHEQALGFRYIIFGQPLWISILGLLAGYLSNEDGTSAILVFKKTKMISLVAGLLIALIAGAEVRASWISHPLFEAHHQRLEAARQQLIKLEQDAMPLTLYPDGAVLFQRATSLREMNLSLFRNEEPSGE